MKAFFVKLFSGLISLITPILLVLTVVRLLLTPVFLQIEYHLPAFPPDQFGFSQQDRLYWSGFALDYLLNDQGIEFLGNLKFENGNPVYNQRELQHMIDVKVVVQKVLLVWYALIAFFILVGILAWKTGTWGDFRLALANGGLFTIILLALVIIFVLIGFGMFFVAFHNVFFTPGTWTFLWSDTLIRLFPERFWRDAFLFASGLAMILGWVLWRCGKRA